jgi:hypothetical protein
MGAVTLRLHGILNLYTAARVSTLVLTSAGSATVGEFMQSAGVPLDLLEMVVRNGETVSLDAPVADDDLLEAFPLAGGG